jgi:hypothetical protein
MTNSNDETWSEVFASWNSSDSGFEYAGKSLDIWKNDLISIKDFNLYIEKHVEMSFLFRDGRDRLTLIHHVKHGTGNTYYGFTGNTMTTPPVEFDILPELFAIKTFTLQPVTTQPTTKPAPVTQDTDGDGVLVALDKAP